METARKINNDLYLINKIRQQDIDKIHKDVKENTLTKEKQSYIGIRNNKNLKEYYNIANTNEGEGENSKILNDILSDSDICLRIYITTSSKKDLIDFVNRVDFIENTYFSNRLIITNEFKESIIESGNKINVRRCKNNSADGKTVFKLSIKSTPTREECSFDYDINKHEFYRRTYDETLNRSVLNSIYDNLYRQILDRLQLTYDTFSFTFENCFNREYTENHIIINNERDVIFTNSNEITKEEKEMYDSQNIKIKIIQENK
mgnify:CR=1 FL=1